MAAGAPSSHGAQFGYVQRTSVCISSSGMAPADLGMALAERAKRIAEGARRLHGPMGNRANTRALLVEPMLAALGWDIGDLDHVVRDWPLNARAAVSYVLRLDGSSAVFVEARGVEEPLEEDFAELIDGAIADPARWWVLTNGLTYRLYAADAEGRVGSRLFELSIADVAADTNGVQATLSLLSRDSLADGTLERRAEQTLTDPRVHEALARLCANPSPAFIAAMNDVLGAPALPVDQLRSSLARRFGPQTGATAASPTAPAVARVEPLSRPPEPPAREPSPPDPFAQADAVSAARAAQDARVPGGPWVPGAAMVPELAAAAVRAHPPSEPRAFDTWGAQREAAAPVADEPPAGAVTAQPGEYPLANHLDGRSAAIVACFERLDADALSLGPDTSRRVRKQYIEYFRGRSFWFTMEVHDGLILLYFALDAAAVEAWSAEDPSRGQIAVRARGLGETEYAVSDAAQLEDGHNLVRLAYERLAAPELT